MLSGRRALQRICKAAAEREINYLSPNAKQRKQMSRDKDELQIVGPPFAPRSLPIMSKGGEGGGGLSAETRGGGGNKGARHGPGLSNVEAGCSYIFEVSKLEIK